MWYESAVRGGGGIFGPVYFCTVAVWTTLLSQNPSAWSHAAPRVYLLKVRIIEEEKQTEEKAKVITIV